ncbi:hypothetical protein BC940DRAFT_310572 [Gongronella butleri]|nr:hypothetical protein BC940DRAFT_310572 [Gongronella butleri]
MAITTSQGAKSSRAAGRFELVYAGSTSSGYHRHKRASRSGARTDNWSPPHRARGPRRDGLKENRYSSLYYIYSSSTSQQHEGTFFSGDARAAAAAAVASPMEAKVSPPSSPVVIPSFFVAAPNVPVAPILSSSPSGSRDQQQSRRSYYTTTSGPMPTKIDATTPGKHTNFKKSGEEQRDKSGPRRSINQEERNRRMKLNLCLYCAKPGHLARTCPNQPNNRKKN